MKGALSKQSDPSWSEEIFTIAKVIKSRNPVVADAYILNGKDSMFKYSRTDLLPMYVQPESPPALPEMRRTRAIADQEEIVEGQFTRAKKIALEARQEKRKTRSQTETPVTKRKVTETKAAKKPSQKPAKKNRKMLEVGDVIFVQYPDQKYRAKVTRVSPTSVSVLFPDTNTQTTIKKSQFNLLSRA